MNVNNIAFIIVNLLTAHNCPYKKTSHMQQPQQKPSQPERTQHTHTLRTKTSKKRSRTICAQHVDTANSIVRRCFRQRAQLVVGQTPHIVYTHTRTHVPNVCRTCIIMRCIIRKLSDMICVCLCVCFCSRTDAMWHHSKSPYACYGCIISKLLVLFSLCIFEYAFFTLSFDIIH